MNWKKHKRAVEITWSVHIGCMHSAVQFKCTASFPLAMVVN